MAGDKRGSIVRALRAAAMAVASCSMLLACGAPPRQPFVRSTAMAGSTSSAPAREPAFIALCYHDVADNEPDQTFNAVSVRKLVEQLSWLQQDGYHFVTVDDILAARDGRMPLPPKAVLLTFDDGYKSFATRVLPILEALRIPAVLATVGSWTDAASGRPAADRGSAPQTELMTWDDVREAMASGLVEIAAHSNGLHNGLAANPQGNLEPAAVTRAFAPSIGYESEQQYRDRIDADLERIATVTERETGRRPRVMVWPYGEHSRLAVTIAGRHGMPVTMTLVDGAAAAAGADALPRHLVADDPGLGGFVSDIRQLAADEGPMRVVQVDLDYVYDPDPEQQERNLGALVQRMSEIGANTVFLQAFADPQGDGVARAVYFPNRRLPVRADLFNRAAWQLRTRAHVKVYAWLPVLAFDIAGAQRIEAVGSPTHAPDGTPAAGPVPLRLSPFDPVARRAVVEIYEDLARSSSVEGILFHDDAVMSDFEDASPAARAAYAAAGFPASVEEIRADSGTRRRWTAFKTDTLIDMTHELAEHARRFRSPLRTARDIYARPMLEPDSAAWFAQDYDRFLAAYDRVVVMAMPLMEGVGSTDADDFLRRLVAVAASRPVGLRRTVFQLQAVDWHDGGAGPTRPASPVAAGTLAREMRLLESLGARDFGYYPDDFPRQLPDLPTVRAAFSLATHPYRKP